MIFFSATCITISSDNLWLISFRKIPYNNSKVFKEGWVTFVKCIVGYMPRRRVENNINLLNVFLMCKKALEDRFQSYNDGFNKVTIVVIIMNVMAWWELIQTITEYSLFSCYQQMPLLTLPVTDRQIVSSLHPAHNSYAL